MIMNTSHPEPDMKCVWLVKMWTQTPNERVIGVFSSEARALEIAQAMETTINEHADYEVDCFQLDVAPVAGL